MDEHQTPVIRQLSKSMINKIAAGEVVERPANAVKELVENSIDAGATQIQVEIEKSGVELIRVVDNGCGIPADQLELALAPHATSKITELDDLFRIATLGFRGEALASIAEISHLTLTTRSVHADEGARIRCDGNERGPVETIGRNVGTTVEVRDLFFNVPVRRKFLKSAMAEYGQCKEAFARLAIPHPEIAFSLRRNGSLEMDLPKATDMLDRIRRIYGDRVADDLVAVEPQQSRNGVVVSGYIGRPELTRGTSAMQYLFVNGRFFKDRALFGALKNAYRGLLKQGMYPVVFLNIQTPPDFVDVNVHPTKQEVHFLDGQAIFAKVLHSARDRLLASNLERRPDSQTIADAAGLPRPLPPLPSGMRESNSSPASEDRSGEIRSTSDADSSPSGLAPSVLEGTRDQFNDWFKETKEARDRQRAKDGLDSDSVKRTIHDADDDSSRRNVRDSNDAPYPPRRSEAANNPAQLTRLLSGRTSEFKKFPNLIDVAPSSRSGVSASRAPAEESATSGAAGRRVAEGGKSEREQAPLVQPPEPQTALSFDERRARIKANNDSDFYAKNRFFAQTSDGRPVVQLCNRYIVMEAPDGVAIADQHAIHERILYEKIKSSYEKGSVQVQRLLVPESVDLSPTEFAFAVEKKDLFAKLGIQLEPLGGSTVIINGYPSIFSKTSPAEIFQAALGKLRSQRSESTNLADLVDGALQQMACKAAIKAGYKLTPDDVADLVACAEMEVFAHHCPHGRPTTVVFTTAKLDQFFIRD